MHSTTPYSTVETLLFSPATDSKDQDQPAAPTFQNHASMAGMAAGRPFADLQRRATSPAQPASQSSGPVVMASCTVQCIWYGLHLSCLSGPSCRRMTEPPGRATLRGLGISNECRERRESRGPTSILRRGLPRPKRSDLAEKFGRMQPVHTAHVRWWSRCCPWPMQAGSGRLQAGFFLIERVACSLGG